MQDVISISYICWDLLWVLWLWTLVQFLLAFIVSIKNKSAVIMMSLPLYVTRSFSLTVFNILVCCCCSEHLVFWYDERSFFSSLLCLVFCILSDLGRQLLPQIKKASSVILLQKCFSPLSWASSSVSTFCRFSLCKAS